jgi:chromate transporter
MVLLVLFAEFFKIGLFSIGGGLATVPFLYELSSRYEWLTVADIATMIAVAEATPGAIGVNMATFAGFRCAGVPGGIIATLGLITPSIVIVVIIARILDQFRENRTVAAVFYGLRPAATGLIAAAGFGILRLSLVSDTAGAWYTFFKWRELILFVVIFVLLQCLKKSKAGHPVLYLAAAAVAGVVLGL